MASGITVTSNPDPAQLEGLWVTSWPTWGCEVSTFPWTCDEQGTCLLLEGDVTVTPDDGEPVRFGAGDLVVFDAGLRCTWDVPPGAQALPLWLSVAARVEPMQTPPRPTPRETTGAMVRNIGQELTGSWMAHLLICSKELLHNLLIDTVRPPQRINAPE